MTSIEAYTAIRDNGLLSVRRWQVYEFVFKYGPCTQRDCNKFYARPGTNTGNFGTRFSELRNMGLLVEVGRRHDDETGMDNILWDVTASMPTKIQKKKPLRQVVAEQLKTINELKVSLESRRCEICGGQR